ncbi:cytochrome c oxidase subunit 7A2, mitochondrial-like [Spea bombifrons]|uniref:cytochrome c oxidase subunit 7A2, mitochondrial-like n=1 Tax=Spea bombifrons TaxID=233779 RepID=UPI00234AB280|nr:cytochrome c oxidase subunit 7A2, mitochondrial-like [Spea bombifrons]
MRNYLILGHRLSKGFATSSQTRIQNKVLEKQKIFQADNDLPIHTKGGMADVILFRLTMAISIAGTSLSLFELFKASRPKQNK